MSELFLAEPRSIYRRRPAIIVDCSVLAALLFDEPSRDEAKRLIQGKSLYAPWLIDAELISVALKKTKEGRGDVAKQGLEETPQLNLKRRKTNVLAQWRLASHENLSAYDAAYLQLAIEMNAPLVTFDKALGAVAARVLGGR